MSSTYRSPLPVPETPNVRLLTAWTDRPDRSTFHWFHRPVERAVGLPL